MWVFGRSGGPFFLKNGKEANNYFMLKRLQLLRISRTIFMIDSFKRNIGISFRSLYVLRFEPYGYSKQFDDFM